MRRFASQSMRRECASPPDIKTMQNGCEDLPVKSAQKRRLVASSADLGCLVPPYILYIHRVGKVCRRARSAAELASCKLWGASRRLTFCTSIEFFTRGFPFGKVCHRYTGVAGRFACRSALKSRTIIIFVS